MGGSLRCGAGPAPTADQFGDEGSLRRLTASRRRARVLVRLGVGQRPLPVRDADGRPPCRRGRADRRHGARDHIALVSAGGAAGQVAAGARRAVETGAWSRRRAGLVEAGLRPWAPFDERWGRFDKATAILRALLRRKSRARGATSPSRTPRTAAPGGGVPLWIGSWGSAAGLRRVARLGDGWLASAYNTTPEPSRRRRPTLPRSSAGRPRSDRLPERARRCGPGSPRTSARPTASCATSWDRCCGAIRTVRDQLCVGPAERCAELLSRYAEAGCGRVPVAARREPAGRAGRDRVLPARSVARPRAPADKTWADRPGAARLTTAGWRWSRGGAEGRPSPARRLLDRRIARRGSRPEEADPANRSPPPRPHLSVALLAPPPPSFPTPPAPRPRPAGRIVGLWRAPAQPAPLVRVGHAGPLLLRSRQLRRVGARRVELPTCIAPDLRLRAVRMPSTPRARLRGRDRRHGRLGIDRFILVGHSLEARSRRVAAATRTGSPPRSLPPRRAGRIRAGALSRPGARRVVGGVIPVAMSNPVVLTGLYMTVVTNRSLPETEFLQRIIRRAQVCGPGALTATRAVVAEGSPDGIGGGPCPTRARRVSGGDRDRLVHIGHLSGVRTSCPGAGGLVRRGHPPARASPRPRPVPRRPVTQRDSSVGAPPGGGATARSRPRRRRELHAAHVAVLAASGRSASNTWPVCSQWVQNRTVGPAPQIDAPTAPKSAARSTRSIERG